MKDAIVALLQQRMDKCTNEQYWAVASVTALDTVIITSHKDGMASIPVYAQILALTAATAYGIWFVIQRHTNYYRLRKDMAEHLRDEKGIPDFLKSVPRPRSLNTLSGVVFYVFWMVIGWMGCYIVVS